MSSVSLVEFVDGVAANWHEFSNSWGGAARVWQTLFEKYIPKKSEWDGFLTAADDGRLWKVCRDERLSDAERIVYGFCCDDALVKRGDFRRMADALREFARQNPVSGVVCHMEGFAKVFDDASGDAIGLYATSVGEDPWTTYDDKKDEYAPYDIRTGSKHWFLFDELEKFGVAKHS